MTNKMKMRTMMIIMVRNKTPGGSMIPASQRQLHDDSPSTADSLDALLKAETTKRLIDDSPNSVLVKF
jgi:hypothetical protein